MKFIYTVLTINLMLLFALAHVALADTVSVKGNASIIYKGKLFSNEPDVKYKNTAIEAAKVNAWKRYVSVLDGAARQNYNKHKSVIESSLDDYIVDYSIVDQYVEKDKKSFNVTIRINVDQGAVDSKINESSQAMQSSDDGSIFVFLFLAREASTVKSFDDKKVSIENKKKALNNSETTNVQGGNVTYNSSDEDFTKVITGGNTEIKADKITYKIISSSNVNAATTDILSTSGFDVYEYGDVVSECGGTEPDLIRSHFETSSEMKREYRKGAIEGARECEASYFAVGTLDAGQTDIDPVSGLKRVFVTVNSQVWNVEKRLPKAVASVGPVQYQGVGPNQTVARTNALKLAANEAAKVIVNQLNAKNLH